MAKSTINQWRSFRPTENSGFSWFPFDVTNWLTSPVVNAMSPTAQGIYIRFLAVQWRDTYISTDLKSMAVQTGLDTRTCKGWFDTWGEHVFVCIDHPLERCDVFHSSRKRREVSGNTSNPREVRGDSKQSPEHLGTYRGDSAECLRVVNGKLHFLSITQGKLSSKFVEESRVEESRGKQSKSIQSVSSFSSNSLVSSLEKDPEEVAEEIEEDDDEWI